MLIGGLSLRASRVDVLPVCSLMWQVGAKRFPGCPENYPLLEIGGCSVSGFGSLDSRKVRSPFLTGLFGSDSVNSMLPVQRPVLDRLADVFGLDAFRAREVGDRAGDFEDADAGAGA